MRSMPGFAGSPNIRDSGKHRPDIAEGYYCFPEGSHLIFYLIGTDAIDVIGVPHKQMDVPAYFGGVEP
ncbi:MAG: type II toxin-antitoxin system RelE/ParE family toxin [Paludibaculum sp.]